VARERPSGSNGLVDRTYRVLGRELQIHLGDITRVEVDAIVSSENSDLIMDHAGGASVSGAIRAVEGDAVAATLTRLGPIEPGQAVVTPAAHLPAKWIVHAAAVVKTEAGHWTTLEILRGAVRSSLALAAGLGLQSIAFPAFGVRATNIGVEASCQAMVDEIVAFLRGPSSIRRVVIALLDPGAFLEFFEAALRRGAQANTPLVLRIGAAGGGFTVAPSTTGPSAPLASVFSAALPSDLAQSLQTLRQGALRRLRDLEGDLLALGEQLWRSLPQPVQALLHEGSARSVRLELDEDIAWLPLELAHDGSSFLAERTVSRHLVSRVAGSAPPPLGPPGGALPMLLAAGDPRSLPASEAEARELVDLLWRRAGPRVRLTLLAGARATRSALEAALPGAALIHWCGHTTSAGPTWELSDGELTPAEISQLHLSARLVVLNSCGPQGGVAFPRAFLLGGAQNVIGSLWDVEDRHAREFAVAFYEALCLGKTLGGALSDARNALRPAGLVHWLAYQHWGDPSARLFGPGA